MKAGVNAKRNIWQVECSMCSLVMMCEILRGPAKTYEQVTLDFDAIPLTDKKALQAQKRNKTKGKGEGNTS